VCTQTIPADTLTTNETYAFTVLVTSTVTGLSSAPIVSVIGVESGVTTDVTVNVLGVSPSGVVATQKYLQLAGSYAMAQGYTATPQTQVAFSWDCEVISGADACPDLANFTDVVASKPNSNNLVLFPGALQPNGQYAFRLTVTTSYPFGTGFGEVLVRANQLPVGGSFGVGPLEGIQFQDLFTLLVGGWVDPDGGKLTYNYFASYGGVTTALLSQPTVQDSIFTSSLPVGTVSLSANVIDDAGDIVATNSIDVVVNASSSANVAVVVNVLQQYAN